MYGGYENRRVSRNVYFFVRFPNLSALQVLISVPLACCVPSFLSATHLVGSGELLEDESKGLLANERSAFAIGASLAASSGFATNGLPAMEAVQETQTRLSLGRHDPLSTLSVMLRVNDDYPMDDNAFFQCIVRYVEKTAKHW